MKEFSTDECDRRHLPQKVLWVIAIALLTGSGTAMGTALVFSLEARSEAREVKADCESHQAASDKEWDWLKRTLTRIESDVRILRNGHAHTESATADGEG